MNNETILRVDQNVVPSRKLFKQLLNQNILFHREFYAVLKNFFQCRFSRQNFSLLDLGCGDAYFISEALKGSAISAYAGVDLSRLALSHAKEQLAWIKHKTFLCEDMCGVLTNLTPSFDIVFSGFSLHHLDVDEKNLFLHHTLQRAKPGGYLLIMDILKDEGQSDAAWAQNFFSSLNTQLPLTKEDQWHLQTHLLHKDHPESESYYESLAVKTGWDDFTVLMKKPNVAFMVLTKGA